jgi:hypothetical protein
MTWVPAPVWSTKENRSGFGLSEISQIRLVVLSNRLIGGIRPNLRDIGIKIYCIEAIIT